jgi:hypothetical protein
LNFEDFSQWAWTRSGRKSGQHRQLVQRFIAKVLTTGRLRTVRTGLIPGIYRCQRATQNFMSREFGAMREIMALADKANQYIDEKNPG